MWPSLEARVEEEDEHTGEGVELCDRGVKKSVMVVQRGVGGCVCVCGVGWFKENDSSLSKTLLTKSHGHRSNERHWWG